MIDITNRQHTLGNGYITFRNVHLSGLPDSIVIEDETLPIQTEHHITLLCAIELAEALDTDDPEAMMHSIVQDFIKFESQHHLDHYQLGEKFYLVEKDDKKSVVIDCQVPNLEQLFDQLDAKYNYKFDRQWPHITLYARNNEGIGLPSVELLKELARPVQLNITPTKI